MMMKLFFRRLLKYTACTIEEFKDNIGTEEELETASILLDFANTRSSADAPALTLPRIF